MNDRFKFRVWDKEQNKYLSLVSRGEDIDFWISIDNTGVYLVERDNNRDVAFFNDITENVIIQQCTGLKDKNGTLIYEGDILSDAKHKYIIEWSLNDGYFVRKPWIEPLFTYRIDKETTKNTGVIGNIYENKDLLEEK